MFDNKMQAQIDFLIYEVRRLKEAKRWHDFGMDNGQEMSETRDSFDFQWNNLPYGHDLLSDSNFKNKLKHIILDDYLGGGLSEKQIEGLNIADIGCGNGRFTYGFLSMGANVTALDQSNSALHALKSICSEYADKLTIDKINLLDNIDSKYFNKFDLVWCFGVVHHTGNTYRAIDNVCKFLKKGGLLYMMIYGYPERDNAEYFKELSTYERLRFETRNMSYDEKVKYLKAKYPENQIHGYFDAISPQINDTMSFDEIVNFMRFEGFCNIKRTFLKSPHNHFIATKA